MTRPHVRLAIMAKCAPEILQRAVDSARHMIDSACLVIAPRDFGTLPANGFGYCALETRVHQVEWMGYAKTRTKTLELAGADPEVDWVLMIDADDVFLPGATLPDLDFARNVGCDAFKIPVEHRSPGCRWRWYRNGHLMRARAGFAWEGTGGTALHETMTVPYDRFVMRHDELVVCNAPVRGETPNVFRRAFEEEARLLASAGDDLPGDTRTAFYYAQSLKDAGRTKDAFEAFAHRARMRGGNPEEAFWAKLWMGKLASAIGEDPVKWYLVAHQHDTERAEPLVGIADYYRALGRYDDAQTYAEIAGACPYPKTAQWFVDVRAYSEKALRDAGIDP